MNKRQFIRSAALLGTASAASTLHSASGTDAAAAAVTPLNLTDEKFVSADGHGFTSDSIHLGEEPGFSVTPIYQAKNVKGAYQRPPRNPTVGAFEVKMKSLEGGEYAVSAPCGMSIISQTLLTLLSTGDRIVVHRCVYDNVMTLLREHLPRFGIEVVWADMHDLDALRKVLAETQPRVVHFEPYVNPTCEVLDAPAIIRLAKEAGAVSIVDNTWLSPCLFQPLRHGADLVLHSATKYIGGHGSAMGGVVCGSKELVGRIEKTIGVMGGIIRPFDTFLLTQGLKTLRLRMEGHTASAMRVATFLEAHPKVARVRYGGLPSWDERGIGKSYLRGFGGMMGVEWKDAATHESFGQRLKLCKPWVSLGDVVTLVSKRGEQRDRAIPPRYTRISIGLEDAADIISDFQQALA